jgi:repressor LexA
MPAEKLSEKQEQILATIQKFLDKSGYPPSVRELMQAGNISSTSVVKYNLVKLEALKLIEHDKNVSRGLRLTARGQQYLQQLGRGKPARKSRSRSLGDLLRIPVLGRIAAGHPLPVPGSNFNSMGEKALLLTRDIVKEQEGLYALEVRGDSMIDALVNDGDWVVMKHVQEVSNGEMAAVWLKDREETTLKYFFLEGERVRLQPANPTMTPIYVEPGNVEVQGKVIAVVRQLH